MDRDIARFRRAAQLVEGDLRRTTGSEWACEVDDDFVLSVSSGEQTESVLLGRHVEDEAWYIREDATEEQQQAALDDEAAEAVAGEVLEVLRVFGRSWPVCGDHSRPIASCSGVWTCTGPPSHDVAEVGALGRE